MPSRSPTKPAIAGAVAVAVSLTAAYEGLRTKPYKDPAGIPTVCYGDTGVPMRNYTADECKMLLQAREANDYAPGVLKCVSTIGDRPYVFAASIDAAYNAGVGAFCRSPMAAAFNRGDWTAGCNAFRGWRVSAGGKVFSGLVRRREAERNLCLTK